MGLCSRPVDRRIGPVNIDGRPRGVGRRSRLEQIMDTEAHRMLRHDILGRLNSLKLCTTAFSICPEVDERLEFLDDIMKVTDKLDILMASLDDMYAESSVPMHG